MQQPGCNVSTSGRHDDDHDRERDAPPSCAFVRARAAHLSTGSIAIGGPDGCPLPVGGRGSTGGGLPEREVARGRRARRRFGMMWASPDPAAHARTRERSSSLSKQGRRALGAAHMDSRRCVEGVTFSHIVKIRAPSFAWGTLC
eukprot:scaffold1318_cov388-Prasinococcus_capsulatus_cf.AAC.65